MPSTSVFLFAWLSASAAAQIDYGLTLTFYTSNTTTQCGQGSTQDSAAVSFHTTSIPTGFTCFNLDPVFSNPNITYSGDFDPCNGAQPCGVNYTLTNAPGYDAKANYSQIFYAQNAAGGGQPRSAIASRIFQTYSGENCRQGGDSATKTLDPWVEWSCLTSGKCSRLPYRVKSFAIRPAEDQKGKKGCVIAEQNGGSGAKYENAGMRTRSGGTAAMVMTALVSIAWLT